MGEAAADLDAVGDQQQVGLAVAVEVAGIDRVLGEVGVVAVDVRTVVHP